MSQGTIERYSDLGWDTRTRERLQGQIDFLKRVVDEFLGNPHLAQEPFWLGALKTNLSSLSEFLEDPKNLAFFGRTLRVQDLEINVGRRVIVKNGSCLHVPPREFQILEALARNPGFPVSVEELGEELIKKGKPLKNKEDAARIYIRRLRDRIGDDSRNPRYIEYIPDSGYRLMI